MLILADGEEVVRRWTGGVGATPGTRTAGRLQRMTYGHRLAQVFQSVTVLRSEQRQAATVDFKIQTSPPMGSGSSHPYAVCTNACPSLSGPMLQLPTPQPSPSTLVYGELALPSGRRLYIYIAPTSGLMLQLPIPQLNPHTFVYGELTLPSGRLCKIMCASPSR